MAENTRGGNDTEGADTVDGEPRAAAFGREERAGSETSRGTTPIGHGSVEVTQQHEESQEMIMGETDDTPAAPRE